jgi:hypothetical protein
MRGGCFDREMRRGCDKWMKRGRKSDIAVGKRIQMKREESIREVSSIRIRALGGCPEIGIGHREESTIHGIHDIFVFLFSTKFSVTVLGVFSCVLQECVVSFVF